MIFYYLLMFSSNLQFLRHTTALLILQSIHFLSKSQKKKVNFRNFFLRNYQIYSPFFLHPKSDTFNKMYEFSLVILLTTKLFMKTSAVISQFFVAVSIISCRSLGTKIYFVYKFHENLSIRTQDILLTDLKKYVWRKMRFKLNKQFQAKKNYLKNILPLFCNSETIFLVLVNRLYLCQFTKFLYANITQHF